MENKKLSELNHEELKDLFINLISAHEKEPEIIDILAHFITLNLTNKIIEKYHFIEYTTEELIELFIVNYDAPTWEEEDSYWRIAFDVLSPDKILDIIDDIDEHVKAYNKVMTPLEQVRNQVLSSLYKL